MRFSQYEVAYWCCNCFRMGVSRCRNYGLLYLARVAAAEYSVHFFRSSLLDSVCDEHPLVMPLAYLWP